MVRKLIGGNKVGVSGIYEPDENTSLVSAYEDLNNYIFDQNSIVTIKNLGNSTVQDLYIKPDETKVYLVSSSSDTINQYNLSEDGTLSLDYYNNKQFYVALQDTNPQDIFFKDDGTVMYVVGDIAVAPLVAGGEYVYQYALGTAWDVSTATYTTSFRTTTQTGTVLNGIYIGNSGTEMYVCSNQSIWQYTLGTAWDVSTATYVRTLSVSAQDSLVGNVVFKDDGTRMFIIGDTNNRVYQYTLGTAWNISTASFTSSFLQSNEATPRGLCFKSDGTKMYIIGSASRQVYEYRMSTAWDVSTAYYTRNYFDVLDHTFIVSAIEGTTTGVAFSSDGTQIYIIGSALDRVWQFPLTTAWDIRTVDVTPSHFIGDVEVGPTGVYLSEDGRYAYANGSNKITQFRMQTPWDITSIPNDTQIFSVAYQEGGLANSPSDLFFKDDGTVMYVTGQNAVAPLVAGGEYVHQYSLSTAWDITTAGYSTSFQTTTQTGTVLRGMHIGAAGTAMYVNTLGSVYQYTLGTAWDVSSATYDSKSFAVSSQEGNTQAITFKTDGTKMYIVGFNNDTIYQYTLGTAWDVSTASYDSKYHWFLYTGEGNGYGIYFKDDGTKVYITGTDRDSVLSFSLGTAWDVSTATYDNQALGFFGYDGSPSGVFFKSDGTRVYIAADDNDNITSVGLASAWDLTSATVSSMFIPNTASNIQSFVFKPDGTKLYTYDISNDFLQQYFLSSPWNISTVYYDYKWRMLRFYDNNITGLAFKNDGSRFYVVGQDRDRALTFPLETPWEVSPYYNNYSMRLIEGGSRDLYFKPDGTKVYVVGTRAVGIGLTHDSDYIHEFSLSAPWDLNTVGYTTSFYLETWITSNTSSAVFFKPDGTRMYVVKQNKDIYQFSLGTAWDISSITSSPSSISFPELGGSPFLTGMYIGAAGTSMYILGDAPSDRVYQYTLGTAWDVTTATYTNNSYTLSSQQFTNAQGVYFSDDGTKMYAVDSAAFDRVYQYSLSTPWDITTVSYDKKSYLVNFLEGTPYGIAFKSDGSKFYIVGDTNHRITEFPLETPWDIENTHPDVNINASIESETYGFDFKTYNVSSVETDPQGLFFKPDGTTMYVVGQTAPTWSVPGGLTANAEYVHQFSLGTAWDVNTVGYTTSFQVTTEAPTPTDMYIGAAGTSMYIIGSTNDTIYQYTLGTAWDVSSASYSGISTVVSSQLSTPTGLTFKPDGTKMYACGTSKDTIFQYSLSSAWDISTSSFETQFYIGATNANSHAIEFSSDGTLLYIIGTGGILYEYELSIAWDVSSAFYRGFNLNIDNGIRGLYIKPDGLSIYITSLNWDNVVQINLKEPYKLFPPATKTLNSAVVQTNMTGIEVSPDLQKLYMVGGRGFFRFTFNP